MKKLIIIACILFTIGFGIVPESLIGTWKMYREGSRKHLLITITKDSFSIYGVKLKFVKSVRNDNSIFVGITHIGTVQVYMLDDEDRLCVYLISDAGCGKHYLK